MPGKSDIEAGRAFVELFIKDKGWSKGLANAGKQLRSWGKGISIFGAAVTAAGAAVVTPLLAMAREFANTGSALNDMSARTGVSVESLSELKFAAEQSGASLEDVEKSLRFMAKSGENVKNFDQLAAKIAAIEDPSKRAEAAIKHWGKGGTAILPMIADLQKLRAEARAAGLVMSGDSAKRADALGDAFDKLRSIVKAVRLVIGDALSETLRAAIGSVTEMAIRIGKWVSANRELFVSALKIGAAVMGIGAVISGLGLGMIVVGSAIAAFNTLLGVAAGMLSALVSPIGLVVAGVVGLATWFATSTDFGRKFVQSLIGWFGDLLKITKETFGGIADAIAAGDLALAGKIAMAGLKSVWLSGIEPLRETWIRFFNWLTETMTLTALEIARQATQIWNAITHGPEAWTATIGNLMASIGEAAGHAWSKSADADTAKAQDAAHERAKQYLSDEAVQQMKQIEDAGRAINKYYDDAERMVPSADAQTKKDIATARKEMADAQEQLHALTVKAAQEREDKELAGGPKFEPGKMGLSGDLLNQKVFGSFSAAALTAGGGGMSAPDAATVKELREQRHIHLMALKALDEMRRWSMT